MGGGLGSTLVGHASSASGGAGAGDTTTVTEGAAAGSRAGLLGVRAASSEGSEEKEERSRVEASVPLLWCRVRSLRILRMALDCGGRAPGGGGVDKKTLPSDPQT